MSEITRGWWSLGVNLKLNDIDREHIAKCIIEGYTEGELIQECDVK